MAKPIKPPTTHERADIQPCKRCGEPVFFATTIKQGRPVPLNPAPRHAYTLKWVSMGTPQGGHFLARYQIVYETHIETCPEMWKGD